MRTQRRERKQTLEEEKRERGTSETNRGLGGVIRRASGTERGSVRTSRSALEIKSFNEKGAIRGKRSHPHC